jgi:hypothetical protein
LVAHNNLTQYLYYILSRINQPNKLKKQAGYNDPVGQSSVQINTSGYDANPCSLFRN